MHALETTLSNILALTPYERFQVLRNLEKYNDNREFTVYCAIALLILLTALLSVSFRRIRKEKKIAAGMFAEYAQQRGLDQEELRVLQKIILKVGLNEPSSIFSMSTAFDKGSESIRKELFKRQNIDEISRLDPILARLRMKLGFQREVSFSKGLSGTSGTVSSRQIPVAKEVILERESKFGVETIEAKVIRNNDNELAVKLAKQTTIIFGQSWKVRYIFGPSIWEFESFVTSYDGNVMGLSHNDDVRFVNRRRFKRAPVQKQAYIALFPFERKLKRTIETSPDGERRDLYPDIPLKPLQFVPAVVTELGGPGLKIETSMHVQQGDRILIMFELERERERNLVKNPQTDTFTQISTSTLKVIQNVGVVEETAIVRRTEEKPECFIIAVEMVGLKDSDIDCLIRATNEASINVEENTKAANYSIPQRVKV